jgi:hypothetical protein
MNLSKIIPTLTAGLALFAGQAFAQAASSNLSAKSMKTADQTDHYIHARYSAPRS